MKRSSCVLAVLAVALGTAGPTGAVIKVDFLHKQFHSRPDRPIKWTKPFPFRVDQVSAAAPGRILKTTKRPRQNLFVVTTDGRVWELENTR